MRAECPNNKVEVLTIFCSSSLASLILSLSLLSTTKIRPCEGQEKTVWLSMILPAYHAPDLDMHSSLLAVEQRVGEPGTSWCVIMRYDNVLVDKVT